MAYQNILLGVFLLSLNGYWVSAEDKPCAGHDIKVEYFRNCAEPKNQNIKLQSMTFTVTDDCKVIPRGCFKVKKPVSGGKVDYYINKPPFKKKGSEDFCKTLESPDTQKSLEGYKSMPHKCTIAAGDYCIKQGSTTVEQLNPKVLTLLTGTTTGQFMIANEGSQDKTCMEFKLVVTRKG